MIVVQILQLRGSNPVAECPPSRLAFDGSHSGGRYGETAFACQSVASVVAGLFT